MSATSIALTFLLVGYSVFVVFVLVMVIHLLVTIWRTPKNIAESFRLWQDYRACNRS